MTLLSAIVNLFSLLHLALRHVQLGVFRATLDLVQVPLDALNRPLAAAPVRFRRARGKISLAIRPAAAPVRVEVSGLDLVLCLHHTPVTEAAAAAAWKRDFLFLDMVTRLARRRSFTAAAPPPAPPPPPPRRRLSLGGSCARLAVGVANLLVRVEVTDAACRFEDAPPAPMESATPGFAFAVTAQVDSLVSAAARQPLVGIPSRGFHRVVRVDGFRAFYDPGVVRAAGGYVAQRVQTDAAANCADKEEVRVMDYVPAGYQPFIVAPCLDVNIRLDGVTFGVVLRFVFSEGLDISLRDYEFQAGLASILRIPLFLSSTVALGGSRDIALEREASDGAMARFNTRARERYYRLYRAAVASGMNGTAASNFSLLEETMTLDECMALRAYSEALDLQELCRNLWDGLPSVSGNTLLARLSKGFAKRLKAAEAGLGGVAANDWGGNDAENADPSLSLHFEFPECHVHLRSSSPNERVGVRARARLSGVLTDMSIDVFDCVRRSALVVAMEVGSFVVKTDEGHRFLQCLGETRGARTSSAAHSRDRRGVSLAPFMTMRFRQDGLLSPAMQSLRLQMSHVHAFAIGEHLRFILEYFVPIDAPLSYMLRRRALKTVATARRNRARLCDAVLALRPFEQAAMLDIRLVDVRCHVAQSHVDAEFFARVLDGEREAGAAPMTPTVVAGFDVLCIETVGPPSYALDSQGNFELTCTPVGLPRDDEFLRDPAGPPAEFCASVPPVLGYDGRSQVASISINISGINLDLITPTSLGHAADEGICRHAAVDLVVVYVGTAYSPAFRSDSYLDVSFGPSGDVRLLSESVLVVADIVNALVAPIIELSARLRTAFEPHPGMSEEETHHAAEVNAYGAIGTGALLNVGLESWVRRNIRRIVGDTHVRLGKCQLVLVHPIGKPIAGASSSRGVSLSRRTRAFLALPLEESFIRTGYFTSLSARHFVRLDEFRVDFSRGAASVRRLVIPSTSASLNVVEKARGPWLGLQRPPVHTDVSCELSTVQVMGQTASLGTLRDLADLIKAVRPKGQETELDRAEGKVDPHAVFERQLSRRSVSRGLVANECFVLSLASRRPTPEIGLDAAGRYLKGVGPGQGVVFCLCPTGQGQVGDMVWMTLHVCDWDVVEGFQPRRLVTEEKNRKVALVDVRTSATSLWRVYGWDTRHIGLQSSSGRFWGVSRPSGECIASPTVSYFKAISIGVHSNSQSRPVHHPGGSQVSVVVHAPSLSLRFGGGGSSLPRAASSASLNGSTVSVPGLLQFDVSDLHVRAVGGEEVADGQSSRQESVWEVDLSCMSSLSFNNLRSRPPTRVSVLAPWTTLLSATLCSTNPVVIMHGDAFRVELSNEVLLQIASALRNHVVDGEDDMSYFAFVNRSDADVSFRVLGFSSEANASLEDGPILDAPRLERVPFSLPESLMAGIPASGRGDQILSKTLAPVAAAAGRAYRGGGGERRRSFMAKARRVRRLGDMISTHESASVVPSAPVVAARSNNCDGNSMTIFVHGYKPVRASFGAIGFEPLKLLPSATGEGSDSEYLPRELVVSVVEDQVRGAMRVELLSPVAVYSSCPFPADLFIFEEGTGPPKRCGRISRNQGELGIAASVMNDSLSVLLEGSHLSGRCSLASVESTGSETGHYLDSAINDNDIGRNGSDDGHEVGPPRPFDHLVLASKSRATARVVMSAMFGPGRTVFHIAPLMVLINGLRSSQIDLILDDGISVPSGVSSSRIRSRSLRSNPSHGRDFVYSAVKVSPGIELPIVTSSQRGEYRLQFRDTGGSWCGPVYFSLKGDPVSRKPVFSESRRFGLGLVVVTGSFDAHCSLRIVISARHIIKNRVPGLALSFRSSASRAVGRSRAFAKKDVFDVPSGSYLHFDSDDAIVGLRDTDIWSKRVVNFPQENDVPVVIRLPSPIERGGIQMVVEAREGGELRFLPIVEIRNDLDVAILVRPFGPAIFGAATKSSSNSLSVPARSSAAFHQEHRGNLFEGGQSLSKVPLSIESYEFEPSGPIHLDEEGTFPLAVRCVRPRRYLLTNTNFMVVGVDIFVAEHSPRRVVRFLPHARYGPSLNVVNHSRHMLFLDDTSGMKYPISCVAPNNMASSFAWSSIAPARKRTLFVSVVSSSSRSIAHPIQVPNLEGSRGSGEIDNDAESIVRFAIEQHASSPVGNSRGRSPADICLGFRFEAENGFMARLHVLEVFDGALQMPVSVGVGKELGMDAVLHSGLAVHFAVPAVSVLVKTPDVDLLSVHARDVYCNILRSDFRFRLGVDVSSLDVVNDAPNPWRQLVFTRATRGRGVDERSVFFSFSSVSRLPHTRVNPSDLWHFESIKISVQPLVVNLESKFVDYAVLHFLRVFSSLQAGTQGGLKVPDGVDEGLVEDVQTIWKVPMFIGTDVDVADVFVNFSFEQNGRLNVGFVREERTRSLTSMLRTLVVSVLPPIREAQVRLRAPELANGIYLSGQLSGKIASHGVKQGMHVIRSLVGNVAVLNAIEIIILGRKKGEAGLRRLGRARALMRRAAMHINRDFLLASVENISGDRINEIVRYEADDWLPHSDTLEVFGYSIDDLVVSPQ